MKYENSRPLSLAVIITFALIIAGFASSSSGQRKLSQSAPMPIRDTSINPHDFSDEYYAENGVIGKAILGRRNGTDFLSVFDKTMNPTYTNVRVIATLPAYGPYGEIRF